MKTAIIPGPVNCPGAAGMKLEGNLKERFLRHLTLPGFGAKSQLKLMNSSILIVGMGGLGCPVSTYLAAAGVGELGLIDHDIVSLSNLQRQVLYSERDVGLPKVFVAEARLRSLHPGLTTRVFKEALDPQNAAERISQFDLVIDATDNFNARYLVNDACVLAGKPYIYGSVFRYEGQMAIFGRPGGPCYRCIFPECPPESAIPDCSEGGVLGVLPGIIGNLQALVAIKALAGSGTEKDLILFDGLNLSMKKLQIDKDPLCRVCGDRPDIRSLSFEQNQPDNFHHLMIESRELPELMEAGKCLLLDVRTHEEREYSNVGGRHIPLKNLEKMQKEQFESGDPAATVIVVCESGQRSLKAAKKLHDWGYAAFSLKGGISALPSIRDSRPQTIIS